MRARAVNRQYLGQNTLRDLDAEYAAGGAANQSHAPRAAKSRAAGSRARVRKWTMTQRLSRNSKIASAGTTATRQSAKKKSVKRLGNLLRTPHEDPSPLWNKDKK
jgi:hypothetical protein